MKKYSKDWRGRQTCTLQQSLLLLFLQIFLMQHMWHNLFNDWKLGATFDYMQRASQAHVPKECIPVSRNPLWKVGFSQNSIQKGSKMFENLAVFCFSIYLRKGRDVYRNWKDKANWKTGLYICFNFVKPNTKNHFSLQFRSSTPCIPLCQCPWRLGNVTQSKIEFKVIEVVTARKIKLS